MNTCDSHLRHQPATSGRFESTRPADRLPTPPIATYFQQSCPTCGRILLILVEHLGRQVYCTHCRCDFISSDGARSRPGVSPIGRSLMERAENLLTSLDSSL